MSVETPNRFPIDHPQYQYPRSKNPYWLKLRGLSELVYSDNETEVHANLWRSRFLEPRESPERELHVEIGCNAGHVIVEWAGSRPQAAFIGIDWKFKSIFRAAEKAQNRNLKNLIFFRAHAERLPFMFGPHEMDSLSLFFPDPWPRKSQWKNRFVNEKNLRSISKLLKPTGVFHIKTDHRGYFDWMLKAVEQTADSWKILEMSMDLHKDNPHPHLLKIPEVTLFEKLFIKDQFPIHSLKLQPVVLDKL